MHTDPYHNSNDVQVFSRQWEPAHVLETRECTDNEKLVGVIL